MNKRIIQSFVVLIAILFGVSLVSESNGKLNTNNSIKNFEEQVSNKEEVVNGSMNGVNVIEEDSSNIISNVNAKVASIVVGGLNKLFKIGIKIIDALAD